MSDALYDDIGRGYAQARVPDPLIAARIRAALGEAASALNVGAGTGSYGPRDRPVVALDPAIRAGMSAVQTMAQTVVESRMARLAADLASGAWDERHGHLRELDELDLGYRLLVTR